MPPKKSGRTKLEEAVIVSTGPTEMGKAYARQS